MLRPDMWWLGIEVAQVERVEDALLMEAANYSVDDFNYEYMLRDLEALLEKERDVGWDIEKLYDPIYLSFRDIVVDRNGNEFPCYRFIAIQICRVWKDE